MRLKPIEYLERTSRMSEASDISPRRRLRFSAREKVVLGLVVMQSIFLYGDPGVTLAGLGSGVLLALVLLGWIFDDRPILPGGKRLRNALVLFLWLSVFGMCIGFARGNGNINILKDFLKFGNIFLVIHFLRGPLETAKVVRMVKWVVAVIYIPTLVAFLGKAGVDVPYFIAAVDYGSECVPIVLIIAAGILFNPRMKKTTSALIFPPLFTLIVAMTRTYWVGGIAGLAVLYFLKVMDSQRRRIWPILFSAGILAGCFYVVVMGVPFGGTATPNVSRIVQIKERLESIETGTVMEDQSVLARLDETTRAIKSIDNWILGNGLGEEVFIDPFTYVKERWYEVPSTWLHNAYVFFLLKMGLLGIGVYLGVLFLLFRIGYETFKITDGFEKGFSAFFIAYLLSASLMSFATGNFISPRCWLLLGICGGLVANIRGRFRLQGQLSRPGKTQLG